MFKENNFIKQILTEIHFYSIRKHKLSEKNFNFDNIKMKKKKENHTLSLKNLESHNMNSYESLLTYIYNSNITQIYAYYEND